MPNLTAQIAQNLSEVRQRIAEAARRSGRRSEQITLVAVTKYSGLEEVHALIELGCTELGESRPQQLWQRAERLQRENVPVRWHLIGHLQRNKVARTLPLVTMIHSADSTRLIAAMEEAAAERVDQPTARVPILLEVNVSHEVAKHGFAPGDVEHCLEQLAGYRHVEVRGLMCMAGLEGGPEDARREFAQLRQLRDRLALVCPPQISLEELSMGMSGDYEVAIEEGATLVRVGSALFAGVTS
jgi:PLP dependent protein